jgi:hypothetical protein
MGLIDKFKGWAGEWMLKVAVKRVGVVVAGAIVGYLTRDDIAALLVKFGVENVQLETLRFEIQAAVTAAAVGIHDWARLKPWGKWL